MCAFMQMIFFVLLLFFFCRMIFCRSKESKQSLHQRQRNLLHLMAQYMIDFGLKRSHAALVDEANLTQEYRVCDNIDLDAIYLDYCSYYQLRFGKQPKVLKKCDTPMTGNEQTVGGKSKPNRSAPKQRSSENRSTKHGVECVRDVESTPLADMISVSSIAIGEPFCTTPGRHASMMGACKISQLREDFLESLSSELKELAALIERFVYDFFALVNYNNMILFICSDIVSRDDQVKWSDVQGNEEAKSILQESVVHPCKYPELFNGIVRPWKGVLLHGPPGIGKTMLAKALSSETFGTVTFFNIASSTVISKWRGESEKFIKVSTNDTRIDLQIISFTKIVQILFRMAKAYAPSVIFIDEFECLATKRDSPGEHEASKRFKNEFLIQIDDLDSGNDNGNVLLLANSNLPWQVCAVEYFIFGTPLFSWFFRLNV